MDILTKTYSDQVPSALDDPKGNLLRPSQLTEHVQDLKTCQAQLDNPNVQDKGAVRQRMGTLKRQYESQAPRPITDGRTKDALVAESKTLLEQILPGMLSKEEMRKNPAGSVDLHMRWERANKAKIKRWKKIQCALNADQSDPHTWDRDAANLERFRPDGAPDRFRADAQITGKMTYGTVPDERWVEVFGKTHPDTSALEQAKRATEAVVEVSAPPAKPAKAPMSEERKQRMRENLARGRATQQLRAQQTKGV